MTYQSGDFSLIRIEFDKAEFDLDTTFQPIHVGHTKYVNFSKIREFKTRHVNLAIIQWIVIRMRLVWTPVSNRYIVVTLDILVFYVKYLCPFRITAT